MLLQNRPLPESMQHSPQTVNLTTESKLEMLESVLDEAVKWGGLGLRRRPSLGTMRRWVEICNISGLTARAATTVVSDDRHVSDDGRGCW